MVTVKVWMNGDKMKELVVVTVKIWMNRDKMRGQGHRDSR